ncbi:MAG: TonB-dependent receptor, partial [bacterium]
DEAAIAAAQQFKFSPAEINGVPSAVVLSFVVNFSLPILPSSFKGRVVDKETNAGVKARVAIRYTGTDLDPVPEAAMNTEVDGSFGFFDVPPGVYDVTLQIPGYDDLQTQIELLNGEESSATYSVNASPENLTGQIQESGTRKKLAATRVQLIDQASGEMVSEAYSNAEGRFGFRGVAPGKYTLKFDADGFFTSTTEIEIKQGEKTTGTFYVEKEFYDEYSVTTTARRARTEVSRQRLELDEVRRIPGTNGDVVRVVQNLPGVARAPFVSGLIVVRGSSPQDTKIFLQGDNIPLVYHFFGGPAVINSEMIEAIDFYPGNFSSYYGRATGGVIDIKTRSPKTDRFHGMADIDLLDATLLVEGPITEDLSFALSGRRSYFDIFLPLVLPEDGPDVFVAPRYYDYQLWLTYKGLKDHKLELFIYGSDDGVELLLPKGEPQGNADVQVTGIDLKNSFIRGQFRWEWRPDLPVENTMMLSYGVNSASFEAAENFFFDLNYYIAQLRNDTRIKLAEEVSVRFGTDMNLGVVDFAITTPRFGDDSDTNDGEGQGRPNFSRDGIQTNSNAGVLQPAVYADLELRPWKQLLLIPGIRVDHFGQIAETSVQPRFSFRWDLADQVTAKGGVGLFTQPTTPGSEDPTFGNPNITYEKALQYALGAEYRPLEYLEFDTTLFYRDQYDLLSPTTKFEITPEGETDPLVFLNEGKGRAYGMEVLLRHYPQNRFFGWIAYTLSWAERLDLNTDKFVPYEFDQRHIFTLVAGYNLPYGIDVSARFRLVTGAPETPVVGSAYNADTDKYEQIFGERGSVRKATFHQLDLRIDKKIVFDTWLLGFYLDVQNVYNQTNQEGIRYNYDFTDSEPVGGLPILPTIGISAQF